MTVTTNQINNSICTSFGHRPSEDSKNIKRGIAGYNTFRVSPSSPKSIRQISKEKYKRNDWKDWGIPTNNFKPFDFERIDGDSLYNI